MKPTVRLPVNHMRSLGSVSASTGPAKCYLPMHRMKAKNKRSVKPRALEEICTIIGAINKFLFPVQSHTGNSTDQ